MPELSWSVFEVWNQSLLVRAEREPQARDYIWASEIGGAMIDRFLKMSGVAPSNPPNIRSLRKFAAADIFEWLVGFVLRRAGILIDGQEKLSFQYSGLLRVSGKLDFLAGGLPDWERAQTDIAQLGLPPMLATASKAIVSHLASIYGDESLKTLVLEIKSLGTFVFDRYEALKQAAPHHRGQIFHYLKAKELSEGHIVYICRDDCRMLEVGIFNPSDAEAAYRKDIETITAFINHNLMPPKEEEVLFDDLTFKFRSNWHIEYSPYLTLLYGYKQPMEYRDRWKSQVASWNRVFKRCVTGANMTTKNHFAITAAKNYFPAWDDLVDKAKIAAQKNPEIVSESEDDAE